MSVFDKDDVDIIDGDVLRRLLKFANKTNDQVFATTDDIQHLNRCTNEATVDISHAKQEIQKLRDADKALASGIKNVEKEMRTIKYLAIATVIILILQLLAILPFAIYIFYPELFDGMLV